MRLTAYDKKTLKYVDSITSNDNEVITNFREDFKKCKVVEE